MEKNEGFKTFYVWFKDALLSKNGYVKVYAEEEEEIEEYEYQGLTDAQLQMLASDENTEVLEHTAYADPSVNMDEVAHLRSFAPNIKRRFLLFASLDK